MCIRDSYGTWQRLSYGSKDVSELAVFMDRVRARIESRGHAGSSAPLPHEGKRSIEEAVWFSVCTESGYAALDALDVPAFAAARRRFLEHPRLETLRLTGTKHPDSTEHRSEQLARALRSAPEGTPDRAERALTHLEWNPLVEARQEFEETIADLRAAARAIMQTLGKRLE